MEQQEFLLEINEIVNGMNNPELVIAGKILVKEAIRVAARAHNREVQITRDYGVNFGGSWVVLNTYEIIEYLREQGFEIQEINATYIIKW